jgi:type IV fimbrial biogenesis protein FimT
MGRGVALSGETVGAGCCGVSACAGFGRGGAAGFSLIEAMVSVALLATLAALAVPNLSAFIQRYKTDETREAFFASVTLARAEAIRLGQRVVVRRLTACGYAGAASNDWSCGWRVFADANNDNVQAADEATLQELTGSRAITVIKANPVNPDYLAIDVYGQVTQSGQRFEIYPSGKSAIDGQLVCFSTGTRLRWLRAATSCPN